METIKSVNKYFFYFVSPDSFNISDPEYCSCSDRTIDMKLHDVANNENLLRLLHLWYMEGNYGVSYTYESRAKWFCGYLSAFKEGAKGELMYEKAITNPTVRLLILDEDLFEKIKQLS